MRSFGLPYPRIERFWAPKCPPGLGPRNRNSPGARGPRSRFAALRWRGWRAVLARLALAWAPRNRAFGAHGSLTGGPPSRQSSTSSTRCQLGSHLRLLCIRADDLSLVDLSHDPQQDPQLLSQSRCLQLFRKLPTHVIYAAAASAAANSHTRWALWSMKIQSGWSGGGSAFLTVMV